MHSRQRQVIQRSPSKQSAIEKEKEADEQQDDREEEEDLPEMKPAPAVTTDNLFRRCIPAAAAQDGQSGVVNYKRFRKVQPAFYSN